MKTIRYICLMVCAALLLAVGAGCKNGEKSLKKIKVSEVTHSLFYAPQYAAINLGFFAEEGLEIDLYNGEGADKVMTAVLSGDMDIGFCGPESSVYVYNEGKEDYCQVFAQLTKRDGSFLMGRTDDEFSWDDVKGKLILPGRKGGVPYMTLLYVMRQNGIEPNVDVTLDESIQYALMAGAFAAGTGDYVTMFEPTASTFEKEGKGYILTSIGQESGEIPYTAYFAKLSYIKKNKDVIQSFTNAIYKGQKWVAEHTAAEIADAVKGSFPDTDMEILTASIQSYKDIDAWNATPVLEEKAFERLQTVISEAGELDQKAPYDKVVNNEYAEKAIEKVK